MDLPTESELRKDPYEALRRFRVLRSELDVAETSAIAFLVRRGWSMNNVGWMLGRSRQAVSQRMQRTLGTTAPHEVLREEGRVQRDEARREQQLDTLRRLQAVNGRRRQRESG